MKLTRNLKNILSLFSVDLGTRFIGFLVVAYLARVLGKSGFGAIHIGLSVLAYVQMVGNCGLTLLGTKKIAAAHPEPSLLTGDIIFLRFIITSLAFLAVLLILNLFNIPQELRLVIIIFILYAFPYALLLEWYFLGLQKMGITSAGRIIGSIFYFVFIVILVKTPGGTVNTAIAWVIGGAANAVFIWFYFRREGKNIKIEIKRLKKSLSLLKEAFPLGLAGFISQAVIMFPALYIGFVSSTSDVGIYSAAYKLIALLLIFDRVFSAVFFPKIVQAVARTPDRLDEIFNMIIKIIVMLGLAIAIPIIVSSNLLIDLIYGGTFQDSVILFQVLVAFFVMTLINSVLSYTLIAIDRERAYTLALLWSMIAFIIGVLLLYSNFSTLGIIFALILYEIIQMGVMVRKIKENLFINFLSSIVLPIITTFVFIIVLVNLNLIIVFKILLGIITGIPLIAISGGLTFKEIKYIKRLLI
jgi:O-antigen/teichoic acid export membrane protein